MAGGFAYCCDYYSQGRYTCGSYYSSCTQYGYFNEYEDCSLYIILQWVFSSIALVALVGMIVIAKQHQRRKMQAHAAEIMHAQNNIIYSDRVQQPLPGQNRGAQRPMPINASLADEGLMRN
jgi:hypothetical protein